MENRSLFKLWGPQLGLMAALSLMLSLISLAQPLYMLNLYDRVLSSQSIDTLITLTIITLFVLVCFGGFDWARHMVQAQMGRSIEREIRPQLMDLAVRLAAVGRDERVRQRVVKVDELKGFVTSGSFLALFDIIFVPIYFAALYLFHPVIFLVCAALALGTVGIALLNEWSLKAPLARHWAHKFHLREEENQLSRNAVDIVTLGRVKPLLARYLDKVAAAEADMESSQRALDRVQTINKVITMVIQTLVLGVACYMVLIREVSTGVMFAVNIVATRAMQPLFQITGSFRSLDRALDGWQDISKSLAKYKKDERAEQPITNAEIRVRSLTIVDEMQDRKTLQHINMDVDPGELVVVTGASGAGKSTLLRAVAGLIPNYVGTLTLDGRELKFWRFDRSAGFIGYLPQEVRLFGTTVAENISGEAEPDMPALIAICQDIGIHEDIAALKDGYQTLLNAETPQFSGGQVRLIGLARALWGNPSVLVLDEPTTGLDPGRESKVLHLILKRKESGAAILVATHAAPFLRAATKLLWLKWGQSKGYGLRDDVLAKMAAREAA